MFKNNYSSTHSQCIHCTVQNCRHHAGNENYCTLQSINIGCQETNPTSCRCTNCQSFEYK